MIVRKVCTYRTGFFCWNKINIREENYYAHFGILFRQIGRNRAKPDALSSLKMAARSSTFVHFPRRFVQSVRKISPELLQSPYKINTICYKIFFYDSHSTSRYSTSLQRLFGQNQPLIILLFSGEM